MSVDQLLPMFNDGQYRAILRFATENDSVIREDPLSAQVIAAAHFQLGNYSDANEILCLHEASLGSDTSYLSLFGATCRRLGNLSKARDLLKAALTLQPESLTVRNNYANLLIDLKEFSEAKLILENILMEDSNYADAKANLNRLKFCLEDLNSDSEVSASWKPLDPLMLAFAEDEVAKSRSKLFAKPASVSSQQLAAKLPDPDEASLASEKLTLAAHAIQEGNPSFALQLVSQAYSALGAQSNVYLNVADAYIRLRQFPEAEICFLHSLQMSGPSLPIFINLSTLSSMRGDLALSRHYLDAAAAIDPEHPQLSQLRQQINSQENNKQAIFIFSEKWVFPVLHQTKS